MSNIIIVATPITKSGPAHKKQRFYIRHNFNVTPYISNLISALLFEPIQFSNPKTTAYRKGENHIFPHDLQRVAAAFNKSRAALHAKSKQELDLEKYTKEKADTPMTGLPLQNAR